MTTTTIDTLLKKISNRFLLANAIATRAKEIIDGSLPYVEDSNPLNPVETAMNEFGGTKLGIKILDGPPKREEKAVEAKDFWSKEVNLEKEDKKKSKKTKAPSKK